MCELLPAATTEAYLVFKYLNTSRTGFLTLDEFYSEFSLDNVA